MLLHSGSPNRVCALREARLPLPATVGASTDFLHHLFAEDLGRGSPSEAFAGRVVELVAELLQLELCHGSDVTLPWKPSAEPPVCVLDSAFLPGRGGVTEPRLGSELSLQVRP